MPPVREIYPLMIGGMSFGALSPNMWEGLQMGVAYLNEELNMPVRICTGEGGCPPRLLRSRFLKYVILQIASGYFGWDEIIHAMPEMKEDPCAVEIKYGQGAKPGRRRTAHVVQGQQAHRRHSRRAPGRESAQPAHPPDPVFHRGVRGQDDPVHVHGLGVPGAGLSQDFGSTTSLAVLNNLTRNPYAAALAIDGEDGGTGAAYNVSMNHMGHPIASNIRDCYLNLTKIGMQNEIPAFAGGGIGKTGNLAANAAALIMLGASGGADRQIHHAGGGRVPRFRNRPLQYLQYRPLPQGHHLPGSPAVPAPGRGAGGRAGGGCFPQLRYRTEEKSWRRWDGRPRCPSACPTPWASMTRMRPSGCRLTTWSEIDNGRFRGCENHRSGDGCMSSEANANQETVIYLSGQQDGERIESRVLEEKMQEAVARRAQPENSGLWPARHRRAALAGR
jgi:hypothetical protein